MRIQSSDDSDSGLFGPVLRGAGAAFAVRILGFAAAYVSQILLARWLGVQEYGAYVFVINLATVVAVFPGLGLQSAVVRFVPQYQTERDWARLRGLLRWSPRIVGSVATGLAILGTMVVWILGGRLAHVAPPAAFLLGVLALPLLALMNLFQGSLRAFRRMTLAFAPPLLLRPILLVAGAAWLWGLGSGGGLRSEQAVGVAVLALVSTVLVQGIALRASYPAELRAGVEPLEEAGTWLRVALPLLLFAGFLVLLARIDVLVIGLFLTRGDVAVYNAAARTANLIGFFLISVNAIAGPTVASMFSRGDVDGMRRLARHLVRWIFWPSLAVAVALVFLSEPVLAMFGRDFVTGKSVLMVLIVGQLVNAGAGSVGVFLNMTGRQDATARVLGWMVLLNLSLNMVAVRILGIHGVALATATTLIVQNIWLRALTIRYLRIDPSIISETVPGGGSPK